MAKSNKGGSIVISFSNQRLRSILLLLMFGLSLYGCSLSPNKGAKEFDAANAQSRPQISDANGNAYADAEQNAILQQFADSIALIRDGQLGQAEKHLNEIKAKYPHLSGLYVNLAMIRWHKGDEEEAQVLIRQALELNSANADAWVFAGIMQRNRGDFMAAEKSYRSAIAVEAAHKNAWMNLAILKDLYLWDHFEALKCYEHYAQLNPDDTRTENWVIDLQRRMVGN
jgi:tetratricopeptide (TPR) repeat protein